MIQIIPIEGIGEITKQTDLVGEILGSEAGRGLKTEDVLVVSSKAVAKWEGNVRKEQEIVISREAEELSRILGKPEAYCQVVQEETEETVRLSKGVIISRNRQGFVLANAGVDASNAGGKGDILPLPEDPEKSARRIREEIGKRTGQLPAVLVADTFGRPFRKGQMDFAVGAAGMEPMLDYQGLSDRQGREMKTTCIAIADELCSAANLAAEKTAGIPAVIIRGYEYPAGDGSIQDTLMERERDLFIQGPSGPEETILARRSVRQYTGEPLKKEQLSLILQAGANAPSAHHTSPWKFVAAVSPEAKEKLIDAMNGRLRQDMEKAGFSEEEISRKAGKSRASFEKAGALILLFLKTLRRDNPLAKSRETEYLLGVQSVALAGGQMLLAAHGQGLGACWYAAPLFCQALLRDFAGLSEEYEAMGLIAVGVPAEASEKPRESWVRPEACCHIL